MVMIYPLNIPIRSSRVMIWVVMALHAVALAVVFFTPIPMVLALPLLTISLMWALYRHSAQYVHFIRCIQLDAQGQACVLMGDNLCSARPLYAWTMPRMLIIYWHLDHKIIAQCVIFDMLSDDNLRRLRVWLRWMQKN